jgi:hypothetical protein
MKMNAKQKNAVALAALEAAMRETVSLVRIAMVRQDVLDRQLLKLVAAGLISPADDADLERLVAGHKELQALNDKIKAAAVAGSTSSTERRQ